MHTMESICHREPVRPHHMEVVTREKDKEFALSPLGHLNETIIGQTETIMEIKRRVLRIAGSELSVLISGESGTGKDLVAKAIHKFSPRTKKPYIKINCPGVPLTLFESELFGYEKGAFTGAFTKTPGKFKLADSGTIFLDEIGEVPLAMQAKLLHVLENKEFSALGSLSNTSVDVRVLAATNMNLDKIVAQKRFRLDLYYRLNALTIHVPPLRERKDDIDLLCHYFLKKHARSLKKPPRSPSNPLRDAFYAHSWPGNIRELENYIRMLVAVGSEEIVWDRLNNRGFAAKPFESGTASPLTTCHRKKASDLFKTCTLKDLCKNAVQEAEKEVIIEVLTYTDWNRKKAAAILKTSYRSLLSKIKDHDLKPNGAIIKKPWPRTPSRPWPLDADWAVG